jgi:predicted alpha/beta hydrolase family esterase
MKRVFIIHGWGGYPDEGIFPWLKKELETRGYQVFNPAMPEPLNPQIIPWVTFLEEQVGIPDKETIFFGHSIGSQTILRYLESLPPDTKVGGAVFLAPWVNLTPAAYETDEDLIIAKPWLETKLDWNKIKLHTSKFTTIFSDDDPLVPVSDSKIFENELRADVIIEHEKGHFSGSDGIKKLPSALASILKIFN